ncbi:MAG: ATPase, partial [Acidobacteriota bacterium]
MITATTNRLGELQQSIESVIRGKSEAVHLAIVTLLAGGHLLVEDVPGVGKTTLAQ